VRASPIPLGFWGSSGALIVLLLDFVYCYFADSLVHAEF
jgi:hypothetical protein